MLSFKCVGGAFSRFDHVLQLQCQIACLTASSLLPLNSVAC